MPLNVQISVTELLRELREREKREGGEGKIPRSREKAKGSARKLNNLIASGRC